MSLSDSARIPRERFAEFEQRFAAPGPDFAAGHAQHRELEGPVREG